ncbi:hypothetical protein BGZ65_003795, partial [Modicella reniformis]
MFKFSKKNKVSTSVASTPEQTPPPSIQIYRTSEPMMPPEEALYKIPHNIMSNAAN